ncbi:NAD(P)/FAD-dependent oxidoreductase [Corynebacterium sp. Q4381]|uniref:NAD(P)/FAD-dependent oxidoreductase n=1 Tax=Corynebacterium sp. Marseille-Q4381 TaxID=3121597 RepID=UPI002FE5BFB8
MADRPIRPAGNRHHVVIIGAGFGGLSAARSLADADVDVTLINRTNHHLFAPLLYQVATGILSSGEIAQSVRQLTRGQDNVRVVRADVQTIDTDAQTVTALDAGETLEFSYDSLILAAGAGQSYFGNDHFAEFAPGMKTVDDALEIRARINDAFERAEHATDPNEREKLLTFVIVGAGPTGVELAGQVAELAHRTLKKGEYSYSTEAAKIVLIDGMPQVLPPFGKRLGKKAQRQLEREGVTVVLNALVSNVDADSVTYKDTKTEQETTIQAATKIWSAGVEASPLGRIVAEQAGVEVNRNGTVQVNPDCSVGEKRNVFIIGDMMSLNKLPGVAQVAIQSGDYVGNLIKDQVAHEVEPDQREPFDYFDKGSMAIISRFNAVAKIGKVEFTGFIAWLMWLIVHAQFLETNRSRVVSAYTWLRNALGTRRYNLASTDGELEQRLARQNKAENN